VLDKKLPNDAQYFAYQEPYYWIVQKYIIAYWNVLFCLIGVILLPIEKKLHAMVMHSPSEKAWFLQIASCEHLNAIVG